LLATDFTVVQIDRRGRGASTNEAADYAIEREGEDLLAVVGAVPQPVMVFGHSYGAAVTLSVIDRLPVAAVLLYEPAFATAGGELIAADLLDSWAAMLAAGQREQALESFYRDVLRFDDASLDALRSLPVWQARIAAVHTGVREGRAANDFRPPRLRPAMPVRILLGEATTPQLTASTRAAAAALEGSELAVLPGQGRVAIDTATELVAQHIRETWARAQP
jgi:pimeloyl-ACP methyl ester carboxylesterase